MCSQEGFDKLGRPTETRQRGWAAVTLKIVHFLVMISALVGIIMACIYLGQSLPRTKGAEVNSATTTTATVTTTVTSHQHTPFASSDIVNNDDLVVYGVHNIKRADNLMNHDQYCTIHPRRRACRLPRSGHQKIPGTPGPKHGGVGTSGLIDRQLTGHEIVWDDAGMSWIDACIAGKLGTKEEFCKDHVGEAKEQCYRQHIKVQPYCNRFLDNKIHSRAGKRKPPKKADKIPPKTLEILRPYTCSDIPELDKYCEDHYKKCLESKKVSREECDADRDTCYNKIDEIIRWCDDSAEEFEPKKEDNKEKPANTLYPEHSEDDDEHDDEDELACPAFPIEECDDDYDECLESKKSAKFCKKQRKQCRKVHDKLVAHCDAQAEAQTADLTSRSPGNQFFYDGGATKTAAGLRRAVSFDDPSPDSVDVLPEIEEADAEGISAYKSPENLTLCTPRIPTMQDCENARHVCGVLRDDTKCKEEIEQCVAAIKNKTEVCSIYLDGAATMLMALSQWPIDVPCEMDLPHCFKVLGDGCHIAQHVCDVINEKVIEKALGHKPYGPYGRAVQKRSTFPADEECEFGGFDDCKEIFGEASCLKGISYKMCQEIRIQKGLPDPELVMAAEKARQDFGMPVEGEECKYGFDVCKMIFGKEECLKGIPCEAIRRQIDVPNPPWVVAAEKARQDFGMPAEDEECEYGLDVCEQVFSKAECQKGVPCEGIRRGLEEGMKAQPPLTKRDAPSCQIVNYTADYCQFATTAACNQAGKESAGCQVWEKLCEFSEVLVEITNPECKATLVADEIVADEGAPLEEDLAPVSDDAADKETSPDEGGPLDQGISADEDASLDQDAPANEDLPAEEAAETRDHDSSDEDAIAEDTADYEEALLEEEEEAEDDIDDDLRFSKSNPFLSEGFSKCQPCQQFRQKVHDCQKSVNYICAAAQLKKPSLYLNATSETDNATDAKLSTRAAKSRPNLHDDESDDIDDVVDDFNDLDESDEGDFADCSEAGTETCFADFVGLLLECQTCTQYHNDLFSSNTTAPYTAGDPSSNDTDKTTTRCTFTTECSWSEAENRTCTMVKKCLHTLPGVNGTQAVLGSITETLNGTGEYELATEVTTSDTGNVTLIPDIGVEFNVTATNNKC